MINPSNKIPVSIEAQSHINEQKIDKDKLNKMIFEKLNIMELDPNKLSDLGIISIAIEDEVIIAKIGLGPEEEFTKLKMKFDKLDVTQLTTDSSSTVNKLNTVVLKQLTPVPTENLTESGSSDKLHAPDSSSKDASAVLDASPSSEVDSEVKSTKGPAAPKPTAPRPAPKNLAPNADRRLVKNEAKPLSLGVYTISLPGNHHTNIKYDGETVRIKLEGYPMVTCNKGESLTIGRKGNLVLNEQHISGNHCTIDWKNEVPTLTDKSTNGTFNTDCFGLDDPKRPRFDDEAVNPPPTGENFQKTQGTILKQGTFYNGYSDSTAAPKPAEPKPFPARITAKGTVISAESGSSDKLHTPDSSKKDTSGILDTSPSSEMDSEVKSRKSPVAAMPSAPKLAPDNLAPNNSGRLARNKAKPLSLGVYTITLSQGEKNVNLNIKYDGSTVKIKYKGKPMVTGNKGKPLTIGRHGDLGILNNNSVSVNHCKITWKNGVPRLIDTSADTKGTFNTDCFALDDPKRPRFDDEPIATSDLEAKLEAMGKELPCNFRQMPMKVGENYIVVSALGHPVRMNDDYKLPLGNLRKAGYPHLISLDTGEGSTKIENEWSRLGGTRDVISIEDFHPPSENNYEDAYSSLKYAAEQGDDVAIHCGEGWGRSGTILASFALRELIDNADPSYGVISLNTEPKTSELVTLGGHANIPRMNVTPLVNKALENVRLQDAEAGSGNSRSTTGSSLENEDQIDSLLKLELRLRKEGHANARLKFSSDLEQQLGISRSMAENIVEARIKLAEQAQAVISEKVQEKVKELITGSITKEVAEKVVRENPEIMNTIREATQVEIANLTVKLGSEENIFTLSYNGDSSGKQSVCIRKEGSGLEVSYPAYELPEATKRKSPTLEELKDECSSLLASQHATSAAVNAASDLLNLTLSGPAWENIDDFGDFIEGAVLDKLPSKSKGKTSVKIEDYKKLANDLSTLLNCMKDDYYQDHSVILTNNLIQILNISSNVLADAENTFETGGKWSPAKKKAKKESLKIREVLLTAINNVKSGTVFENASDEDKSKLVLSAYFSTRSR
ncbi:hypothetical protein SCG7086_AR_00090 [Chlamydiales bacterium SCGC AG-110-P3]|nr:hypothetical protein SCG7086_AR_00090 [Chlamydiales bacterium SCGC AG-110-P3]